MKLKAYLDNTRMENARKRAEARTIEEASSDNLSGKLRGYTETTSGEMLDLYRKWIVGSAVADDATSEITNLIDNVSENEDTAQLISSLKFAIQLVKYAWSSQINDGFDAEFYLSLEIQTAIEFDKFTDYLHNDDEEGERTLEKAKERDKVFHAYKGKVDDLWDDMLDLKEYLESEAVFVITIDY